MKEKKLTFYEKANELFQFWPLLLRDTLELQFMKSNRSPIVAVKGKKKLKNEAMFCGVFISISHESWTYYRAILSEFWYSSHYKS